MTDFKPSVKIILDSVSPNGDRLVTASVTFHRHMLPEWNTHRALSRNGASSRAIPLWKMIEKAKTSNVYPLTWREEKKGMQGGEAITDPDKIAQLRLEWDKAKARSIEAARNLGELGVHKSTANRLLEPFLPHTHVVTGTEFQNFFKQRCHPDAQDEIRIPAEMLRDAINRSIPQFVKYGDWHMPFITEDDWQQALESRLSKAATVGIFTKISAARAARTSYLTHEGTRDWDKDLDLYLRLVSDGHWSPLEHVATPCADPDFGNFDGWRQLRHEVEYE